MFKFKMSLLVKNAKFKAAIVALVISAIVAGIICIPKNKARSISQSVSIWGMPTNVTVGGYPINVIGRDTSSPATGYDTLFCIEQDAMLSYKQYTNPIDIAEAQDYFTNYNSAIWLIYNMYISNVDGGETAKTLLITNLANLVTADSVKTNVKSTFNFDGTSVTPQKIIALKDRRIGGTYNKNAIEAVEQLALWKYTKNTTNNASNAYSDPNTFFVGTDLTNDEQITLKYIYYALTAIADSKAGVTTPKTISNFITLNKSNAQFNEDNYLVGPYYLESNGTKLTSYNFGDVTQGFYPVTVTVTKNDDTTAQLGSEVISKNEDGSFYINLAQYKDNLKKVEFTINNVLTTINNDVYALEGGEMQNLITINKTVSPASLSDSKIIEIKKPEGTYTIILNKVKADGTTVITTSEATFDINGESKTTNAGILEVVSNKQIENENQKDSYTITETKAPDGFRKIAGTLQLDVAFKLNAETKTYLIDSEKTIGTGFEDKTRFEVSPDGTKINVYVVNPEIGKYNVELYKTDENGNIIKTPAEFNINDTPAITQNGVIYLARDKKITDESQVDEFKITETEAPENYVLFDGTIKLTVKMKKDGDNLSIDKDAIMFQVEGNTSDATFKVDESTVKIYVKNTKKIFDLSLRKYISKINDINVEPSREPVIDAESIKELEQTGTAIYHHAKNSLLVNVGDEVEYTIRVYNEGQILGYSKQITDYLPSGLTFVRMADGNSAEYTTKTEAGSRVIVIDYNGNTNIQLLRDFIGKEQVNVTSDYYQEVKVICKVEETNVTYITSRSEITNYGYEEKDINGNIVWVEANKENVDIDSVEKTIEKNLDLDNWYVNAKTYTRDGKNVADYYPGVQDDDDFETVQVMRGVYGLVIRKVDASNNNNGLAGAYFKVVSSKENVVGPTDDKGYITAISGESINPKELQKTITITETIAPEDYRKYDKEIKVEVVAKANGEKYVLDAEKTKLANNDGKVTINVNAETSLITITIPNEKKEFDLALRKFITAVNGKALEESREPKVELDTLINGDPAKNGEKTATYIHSKDPVDVNTTDIVTYTLRVYNEGEVDGYASKVMDDIPEGLEFLPDHEINKDWVMYREVKDGETFNNENIKTYNGKQYVKTENAKEAEIIETSSIENQLIKAFDGKNLDYKDVQVAFKVIEPKTSDRIIINYAQISEHKDKTGTTTVTDRDSRPNEWNKGEDDQDIEKIKVRYFDLSLLKYVSKAIIYENGTKNVIETGHTGYERPEPVVKVDLKNTDLNKVTVKFEYTIKITNDGEPGKAVAGYAKEISDYIPEGLKFIPEDNENWKEVDGKVVTDALKDTLLQPGESAEVTIILTWINDENNMGVKVNTAEISKDYNDYGTPDIDSTPNNKVPGEDDIDDAPVMLAVRTGMPKQYYAVIFGFVAIITAGVVVIKKKVIA